MVIPYATVELLCNIKTLYDLGEAGKSLGIKTTGIIPIVYVDMRATAVGHRALAELGLEHGDPRLVVTIARGSDADDAVATDLTDQALWAERLFDGIWIAAGVKPDGRPSSDGLPSVSDARLLTTIPRLRFEDRSSGHAVILGLNSYILGMMVEADGDDAIALALRMSTLSDAELFDVVASFPVLASP